MPNSGDSSMAISGGCTILKTLTDSFIYLSNFNKLNNNLLTQDYNRSNGQMGGEKINKELLVVLMESPDYFKIPLQNRLNFLKFFSQQNVYNLLRKNNQKLLDKNSPGNMLERLWDKTLL